LTDTPSRPAPNENHLLINAYTTHPQSPLLAVTRRISDSGCNLVDARLSTVGRDVSVTALATGSWDAVAKLETMLGRLEREEGELRTRRIHVDSSVPASSQFLLKVSPKNNGSQHLVAGTEVLAPGASLPKHRHLVQDEILLIQSGTAHVVLGEQERDLHAGGLVFIPANTWISGKNIGTEPIALTFIFSAPGFEDTMRCNSGPANESPTQITQEERKKTAPTKGMPNTKTCKKSPRNESTGDLTC